MTPNQTRMCKRPVIAIDFDGTIVNDAYPEIGTIKENAQRVINKLAETCCILIFTCREGEYAKAAKCCLQKNKVIYMHFNDNCMLRKEKYGSDARKLGADIYIDDKNLFSYDSIDWNEIEARINPIIEKLIAQGDE